MYVGVCISIDCSIISHGMCVFSATDMMISICLAPIQWPLAAARFNLLQAHVLATPPGTWEWKHIHINACVCREERTAACVVVNSVAH